MYRNSNFLFVFAHENVKKLPSKVDNLKKIEENFPYCSDFSNGPKLHFRFMNLIVNIYLLLFILDYTKRKLLHVNFKVVDSQKKKTFYVCLHLHLYFRQKGLNWLK